MRLAAICFNFFNKQQAFTLLKENKNICHFGEEHGSKACNVSIKRSKYIDLCHLFHVSEKLIFHSYEKSTRNFSRKVRDNL